MPWIAIFNPAITSSVREGYYIAYLFHSQGQQVTLSLLQGVTAVNAKHGRVMANQVLINNGRTMLAKIDLEIVRFSDSPISLGSELMLPESYEKGHILGKTYNFSNLPSNEELVNDLNDICKLYANLYYRLEYELEQDSQSRAIQL